MKTHPTLALGALLAALTLAPSAFAQDLGSVLGGILKKAASEILEDPNEAPILEAPAEQATTVRETIPVSNALYDPQGKETRLKDLFTTAKRPNWDAFDPTSVLRTKSIGYPRLAVRFLKYGPDLPCWEIQAVVWTSSKSATEELGEVCRGPIWLKDALGQPAQMNSINASSIANRVKLGATTATEKFANTGDVQTLGPNPPAKPFGYVLTDPELISALDDVITRLAIHTGYLKTYDQNLDLDQRFWGADFDPVGLVQSTRPRRFGGFFESDPVFTSPTPR